MGRKKGNVIAVLLLLVLLSLGGYAAYQLYLSHDAYAQGDRAYEELLQQVVTENPSPTATAVPQQPLTTSAEPEALDTPIQSSGTVTEIDIPDRTVDFAALQAINPDAAAWLYCPDTVIDYPVMAASDYSYYLRHLPDGTYNINGSLFLDYGCAPDFSERLTVIYGHNMKTEKMFGTLVDYKKQSYFEQHPYLYLYTPNGNYRIALLYGAVISASAWTERGYVQDADGLLEYAKENTTFVSSETYTGTEQLIVLSTCSYEYDGARYFVLGLLQPA
jgi:sortase B